MDPVSKPECLTKLLFILWECKFLRFVDVMEQSLSQKHEHPGCIMNIGRTQS